MANLRNNLTTLEMMDLIVRQQDEPELTYAFHHIFTQESVYQSLLQSERRRLHQQIGEALEELYLRPDARSGRRLEELAPVLAYHFQQSGDTARALKYLQIAGDQANKAYANQEARDFYSQALELLPQNDYRRRWEILSRREQVLNRLPEREAQVADLTTMQLLAEMMGSEEHLAETHNRRAAYFDKISEYQDAAAAAEAGAEMARRSGNPRLKAQNLNLLALSAWRRFDYEAVKKWANDALDALRVVGNPADRIVSLIHLARASYRLGQYDAALDYIEAARELAVHTNDGENEAVAHLILGWIYQRLGDYEQAEMHYQTVLDRRHQIGDRHGEATALSHLGWLSYDQQRYETGLEYCQQALTISQAIGDRENEAYALSGKGLNYEQLGQLDAAVAVYQDALAIQEKIGATTLAIFDRTGLARIALQRQQPEAARQQIAPVVEWILDGRAQQFWNPWIIYLSTYKVLTTLGQTDIARTILDEAYQVLQQRAKAISDSSLRNQFLNKVAVNREIIETWEALNRGAGDG